MGTGRNSTKQPDRVPIGEAHERITENIRRAFPAQRMGDADDVDDTLRPLDGHALMYDQLTGTWKPVLSPPIVTFNQHGAVTVEASDRMVQGAAGRVILGTAGLATSGSSTTTAILKHTVGSAGSTTTLATYTFTSGNLTPSSYPTISFVFAQYDRLWLDITAAGTGAKGLVVSVWATAP